MIEDGFVMNFLEGDLKLYPAVFLSSGLGVVVCDRFVLTVTDRGHTIGGDTFLNKVEQYCVCAILRELEVLLRVTGVIGMSLDLDDIGRVVDEGLCDLVHERVGGR